MKVYVIHKVNQGCGDESNECIGVFKSLNEFSDALDGSIPLFEAGSDDLMDFYDDIYFDYEVFEL